MRPKKNKSIQDRFVEQFDDVVRFNLKKFVFLFFSSFINKKSYKTDIRKFKKKATKLFAENSYCARRFVSNGNIVKGR